jgi:nucleoside-diphosphate-sugar epimerase
MFGDVNNLLPWKDTYDVVIDFVCYTPEQAKQRVKLFSGRCGQYVFISTTAMYDREWPVNIPYKEGRAVGNPKWDYAKNKYDSECMFNIYRINDGFLSTIVRPGHTYDTIIPCAIGNNCWTIAQRIIDRKPIPVIGNGNTLWTLTHSEDFSSALISLVEDPQSIGHTYHITSDEWLTWRQIYLLMAEELLHSWDVPVDFIQVPAEYIMKTNPYLGNGIVYHKQYCDIYDNSRIKALLPDWKANINFKAGIHRTINWFRQDYKRMVVDKKLDQYLDHLCEKFGGEE